MRSKKALINVVISLLSQFVAIISSFILPRLYIKNYGSEVNGLVSSIGQFLAYITLLEAGIGPVIKSALYKPIAQNDKKQLANVLRAAEKFFRGIAGIFIVYLIAIVVLFPLLMKSQFDTLFTVSLILIMAIGTFTEYYFSMTYNLYLQAEQKKYITLGIQIVLTIINLIITVFLINFGCSIQIVKLVSAILFIVRPLFLNFYVKKKYNISFEDVDENYKLEQKWDGLAQHIAAIIHNNTDVTVLTLLASLKEVSVYSIHMMVVRGVRSLTQSFTGGIDASFGDMIARNEKENLNKSFSLYETMFFTISTIFFTVALILIVPFINVYTSGITDANYYRPVFACLLVLSEFMWAIRLPYSSITLAAGHFKETMKGAWVESGVNIILSVLLVFKFGIVGVAIGTLVAMIIRTIEFMYHTSKHILDRSVWDTYKRLLIIVLQIILSVVIGNLIPSINIVDYSSWIIQAVIITVITTIIVILTNSLIYTEDTKNVLNKFKTIIFRKKDA